MTVVRNQLYKCINVYGRKIFRSIYRIEENCSSHKHIHSHPLSQQHSICTANILNFERDEKTLHLFLKSIQVLRKRL